MFNTAGQMTMTDPTQAKPIHATAEKLVATASQHFAAKGYDGTAIAPIAQELGITKQALLHHFKSKDLLYTAVLDALSARLSAQVPMIEFSATVHALFAYFTDYPDDARLMMREFLVQSDPVQPSPGGRFQPFFNGLTLLALEHPKWEGCNRIETFAGMFQIVGAVHYWAVAETSLGPAIGRRGVRKVRAAYPSILEQVLGTG
jgi:AcrR family transcriptional regulator